MELNVAERLTLLGLLPSEGNFITLKLVRKLREELSFSEDEIKTLNLVQNVDAEGNGMVNWNQNENAIKDCNIGDAMTDLIKGKLKGLDKEEKLVENQFTLYEKFVEA